MEGTLDPNLVARNLQVIAEGAEVSSTPSIVTACPFFANEEPKFKFGYPQGYFVKPVAEQLAELSKHFPDLDFSFVLNRYRELPILPQGAEGWFVVPKFEKVGKTYNEAVERVLDIIGKTRTFHNYCEGELGAKYLWLSERTAVALMMLGEKQKGDFLLIGGQFGLTHQGRSVRRARVMYAPNEFGLGSFIVGCMLITHPRRLLDWDQVQIDCAGDEYLPDEDGDFSSAPCFYFLDGEVRFDADWVGDANSHCGSASGFLSQ
jgi:hypothetical protein